MIDLLAYCRHQHKPLCQTGKLERNMDDIKHFAEEGKTKAGKIEC